MKFNPELFVTSWFVSPLTLLIFRGMATAITWMNLLLCLFKFGARYFFYFENWSYLGLTLYFTVAFHHSIKYVKTGTTNSFDQSPKFFNQTFWILYHTVLHY
ncbi:10140_t:CDS:2, partial [Entrophospora sp. SA101]